MRIQAAVASAGDPGFTIQDVELDEPRAHEVLVRVEAVGICRTDLIVRDGIYPPPLPAVLGHEGAGVVEQVGSAVRGFEPGDHVALSFNSCGRCSKCLRGHPALCDEILQSNLAGVREDGTSPLAIDGKRVSGNFFGQSSFATHCVTTPRSLVRIPHEMPFELAAPLGCGVQTGAGAVLHALKPAVGSSIVVFGAGSVGLSAVMAARAAGCGTIIAVNRRKERLRVAEELGATHTIDGNAPDILAQIMELTGVGADFVVESTGDEKVIATAVEALGTGGVCGLLSLPTPGKLIGIPMSHLLLGRTLTGIVEGGGSPQVLIPQLVKLHRRGQLPLERIVRTYRFDEINQAVEDSSGSTIKPVLVMS